MERSFDISDPMMAASSSVAAAAAAAATTSPTTTSPSSSSPPWSVLLPELLSEILTRLRPVDVACFRVVCRAWHSAARHHYQQQLPWVVFPDGSFGTMTGDFFRRGIPGVPENVTCLGATGSWLALDRTDDVFRRTNPRDRYDSTTFRFLRPRRDVRHRHSYLLYNPFTGAAVPLPELDSVAGDVPETFEIRKVLVRMRRRRSRPADDDDVLVAVTTNCRNCTMIVCRPAAGGKGIRWVLPCIGIMDVAFFGDALYGMTMEGDLLVFELAPPEEEKEKKTDGKPAIIVSRFKRVISHPLADGEEDELSWMDDYGNINDDDDGDDEAMVAEEDDWMMLEDGKEIEDDEEMTHEPKDLIVTTRHLVTSCDGKELLMVRHQVQTPAQQRAYTRKVDIFKADMDAGQWVPVVTASALSQGEALFLSRVSSEATRAYGDIKEGFVYFVDVDDAFDTRSGTRSPVNFPRQKRQAAEEFLTWVFPPQLVL